MEIDRKIKVIINHDIIAVYIIYCNMIELYTDIYIHTNIQSRRFGYSQ